MYDIVWMLIEWCFACVMVLFIWMLAVGIFKEKRDIPLTRKAGLLLLILIFSTVIMFIHNYFFGFNKLFQLIINAALIISISLVLCKIKVYWAVFFGICILSLIESIGLLISLITFITVPDVDELLNSTQQQFLVLFTLHLLIFLSFRFILWVKKRTSERTQHKMVFALLVYMVLVFIIMLYTGLNKMVRFSYQEYITGFGVLFIIFTGILIFILTKSILQHGLKDKQLGMAAEMLTMQKEYISQMYQKQAQIQQMSHDFKQHIHTLQGLNDSDNRNGITEALERLSHQQLNSAHIVCTGNAMIDALLSIKREIAEREGVACDWNIMIPPQLSIHELDTCAILGNALDNAIEACRRSEVWQPFIKLDIYCETGWLLCGITNPVGEVPHAEGGIFKTVKSDAEHHGLGLQSMKRCCIDMGGNLEVYYDSKRFVLRFMLPLNVVGA